MPKRILFVSHSAARSGAPILLLHLMRWLKANTDYELEVLLLRGGPLEKEFKKLARAPRFARSALFVHRSCTLRGRMAQRRSRLRLLRPLSTPLQAMERRTADRLTAAKGHGAYHLIYANTAATGHAVRLLSRLGCPTLTHIHELDFALDTMKDSWAKLRKYSDGYIAVSQAVQRNLRARYGIFAEKIDVVYGFIDARQKPPDRQTARAKLRQELGIPDNAFLVGGSGTLEWRKGCDLFVELAKSSRAGATVANLSPGPYFVWIGGDLRSSYMQQLREQIRATDTADRVFFIGERTAPRDCYAALDVFALTSREDPFPLVCLEAAACGVPIVCFEGAGGMPEFIEASGGGLVAAHLDVAAMAACLQRLSGDAAFCASLGQAAQREVIAQHDVSVGAPSIAAIIEKYL